MGVADARSLTGRREGARNRREGARKKGAATVRPQRLVKMEAGLRTPAPPELASDHVSDCASGRRHAQRGRSGCDSTHSPRRSSAWLNLRVQGALNREWPRANVKSYPRLHPRRRSRFDCVATTKADPVPAGSAFFVSLPLRRGGRALGAGRVVAYDSPNFLGPTNRASEIIPSHLVYLNIFAIWRTMTIEIR